MNFSEEINALLGKAERFISSAALLKEHGDLVSAASRLYYAMFYCSEALLLTKGLSYSKHASVRPLLQMLLVTPFPVLSDDHSNFFLRRTSLWLAEFLFRSGSSPTLRAFVA